MLNYLDRPYKVEVDKCHRNASLPTYPSKDDTNVRRNGVSIAVIFTYGPWHMYDVWDDSKRQCPLYLLQSDADVCQEAISIKTNLRHIQL
jgi:hypothetical protein